ncbi:phage holin, LLH family [Levilactobacillus cerevisiae]|uniref:phage holin, LLH family n=1 Tax=Levilactobacillus cerevisiae TaxID=1704076 RepID=UPI00345F12FC
MIEGTFDIASVLTFVLTVVPAIYALLRPLVKAKIATQKDERTKHDLEIADNYAAAIVAEMAVMAPLSNSDRKAEAVKYVVNAMQNLGKSISTETAGAKVEAAYQSYKSNGGDVHKDIASTPAAADPDPDDQTQL